MQIKITNFDDLIDAEELIGPRSITACTQVDDGTWEATLSCGHEAVFVVQPPMMLDGCAECVQILLERHRKL